MEERLLELERLLSDRRFKITERQKRLIEYLDNERFRGNDAGVKPHKIATDVSGGQQCKCLV